MHLTKAWHRLKPWPDTVAGLTRLKQRYIIGTLSNGNVGLLTRMAKNAGLPWDVVLGAETARAYKPMPEAYLAAARLLNLEPGQVMLVAAHNGDLAAAAECGLATGFVARPPNTARTRKSTSRPNVRGTSSPTASSVWQRRWGVEFGACLPALRFVTLQPIPERHALLRVSSRAA